MFYYFMAAAVHILQF